MIRETKIFSTSVFLILAVFLTVFVNEGKADNRIKKRWAFGLNYPGLVLKYGVSNRLAIDLHGQLGQDIFVVGPRLQFYLNPASRIMVYLAGEGNYVNFKGDMSKGSGITCAGFLGLEVFLTNRLSFLAELGEGLIRLKDAETSLSESNFHTLVNLGLNFYTLTPEQREQKRKKPLRLKIPKKKFNLAVLDFKAENVSQMDARGVRGFIQGEIVNTGVAVVVERANLEQILAEQAFQLTGCTDQECAVEIGKILQVEKMVIGSFSKVMEIYYISAQVVDVESGEIQVAHSVQVPWAGELKAKAEELARELIRKLLEK